MQQVIEKLAGGKLLSISPSFQAPTTINRLTTLFVILFLQLLSSRIATAEDTSHKDAATLISKENLVDSSRPPAEWRSATVGQELIAHDRLRTGEDSRAAVRFGDSTVLRVDELTEEEILPPQVAGAKPTMDLKQGSVYFFSREKSREIHVQTPAANGTIRGTEFAVVVAADGATSFTILDGEVEISNSQGSVSVQSGEQAEIKPGATPAKTAVTNAIDSVQWCFYYPGVLDINELALSPQEKDRLRESLSAYGQGDILRALEEYPRGRVPASPAEKIYRAGLFLVTGQLRKAEDMLRDIDQNVPGRQALTTLIAAVTLRKNPVPRHRRRRRTGLQNHITGNRNPISPAPCKRRSARPTSTRTLVLPGRELLSHSSTWVAGRRQRRHSREVSSSRRAARPRTRCADLS
jgi:hypothetical protein